MDTIKELDDYQNLAVGKSISLDKFKENYPNLPSELIELISVAYDGLGLGEAGEVQGKIKKIIRDNGGIINDDARNAIKAELGDNLWYIASMARNLGFTLSEVATANIEKIIDRDSRGVRRGSGDYR